LKHKTVGPELSLREIRFCQLYAETENATQSYVDAGFSHGRPTAGQLAFRLLKKVQIREHIQDLRDAACESAKITTAKIARSLSQQAFTDRRAVFDTQGRMKPPHQWPKELAACIAGIEVDNLEEWKVDTESGGRKKAIVGYRWKVKFERSTEAKKILAQWLGMIGAEATGVVPQSNPLVVGGEADPSAL